MGVGHKTLWCSRQPGRAVLPSLVSPPGKETRGSCKCRVSTRWHQTRSSVPSHGGMAGPCPRALELCDPALGAMMAFLAVPHSRVRAVQQLPASSSSQHPSSFGCSCFCSRCKTGERCLKLDPCFSASSPGFILCLLSTSLTWLRCAQSCPAWEGIPVPGAELPTSPPSRQTTAPHPGKEGGSEEVDAGKRELEGPALSSSS